MLHPSRQNNSLKIDAQLPAESGLHLSLLLNQTKPMMPDNETILARIILFQRARIVFVKIIYFCCLFDVYRG